MRRRGASEREKRGWTRAAAAVTQQTLEANLSHLLQEFTGWGCRYRPGVLWTNLSLRGCHDDCQRSARLRVPRRSGGF